MDYSYFFYHRTLVIICFLAQLHLFIDGLFIFLLSQNFGYYMFSCSASLIYRWTIHISFITELEIKNNKHRSFIELHILTFISNLKTIILPRLCNKKTPTVDIIHFPHLEGICNTQTVAAYGD